MKAILCDRKKALQLCDRVCDGMIEIVRFPRRFFLLTSMELRETALTDMERVMAHLQIAWECSAYKTGCGCYISLDKARRGRFEIYDGLFTCVDKIQKGGDVQVRPKGEYLCGYCIGDWDKIPELYRKMLVYAETKKLRLTGNCYEMGLNEFAISGENEYVTRIEMQFENETAHEETIGT